MLAVGVGCSWWRLQSAGLAGLVGVGQADADITHAGLSWECFIGRGRLGLIKRGKEYKLEKCAYFVKLVQHAKCTHCTVNFLNSQFLVLSVSAF